MTSSRLHTAIGSPPHWRDVLELSKPVTWFPPMWAFACGFVSTGQATFAHWPYMIGGILLAGPMVCAASQAINDWFDRDVDAINEPNRPIPSGRIPGRWGLYLGVFWSCMSILLGAFLGTWAFVAAIIAVTLGWVYSAPPLRFKEDGWSGPAVVALAYEGVAWFTGAAVILAVAPGPYIVAAALVYSFGTHGIMTLNDFKAIEGDSQSGVKSLPVRLGVDRAVQLACAIMVLSQILIIAGLIAISMPIHAAIVAGLVVIQILMMRVLLKSPVDKARWYNAAGIPVFVIGMMVTAFAIGSIDGGPGWT